MASPQAQPRERPPDLVLQAIVPPTDAPAEIRAAVTHTQAHALAGQRLRRAYDRAPAHVS